MGSTYFAFDYKNIQWSDTLGYGYVEWEDQDVFALGYQFAQDNWALRVGYNYGKSPIVEQNTNTSDMQAMVKASSVNFFNLLGLPCNLRETLYCGWNLCTD